MKKLLPIILIVVVLAVGAWFFLSKGKGGVSLPGEIKKETGEAGETFTGKLKDAIARGIPMKCTYDQNGYLGTSYIKGNKVYAEIASQGKEGYLIMVDKCMWTWNKGETQGVKMCFETNVWEGGEEGASSAPTEAEYKCSPAIFSDSQFNPPGNIKFMTVEEMMGGTEE